jgi:hypothetical protein
LKSSFRVNATAYFVLRTILQFARAGYRTAVAFRNAEINFRDLETVSLDSDSRLASPDTVSERMVEAFWSVRDARILYKK